MPDNPAGRFAINARRLAVKTREEAESISRSVVAGQTVQTGVVLDTLALVRDLANALQGLANGVSLLSEGR